MPCNCRICRNITPEAHVFLGQIARNEGVSQGGLLTDLIRSRARSAGLLNRQYEERVRNRTRSIGRRRL